MQTKLQNDALQGAILLRGNQLPSIEHAPKSTFTSGDDAIELAAAYGLFLDPWQQHVLKGSLGEQPDGKWTTTRVGLSVPRQNGKNAILEARELAGLLLFGEKLIIHSAHEVRTHMEAFRRIIGYFENYDDLRKMVRAIPRRAGEEAIELKTGQRLKFMARSRNAGRGFTADALLMDEGQELSAMTYAAILPTTIESPNPQVWIVGTPPAPNNNSAVFTAMRNQAMLGEDDRLYYAEWSADPDADYDDETEWANANPALNMRNMTVEGIADKRRSLSDEYFAREVLGIWGSQNQREVIPMDQWALLEGDFLTGKEKPMALSVDVAQDRSMSSVALAAQKGANGHVELIANRNGVNWVVDFVVAIVKRHNIRAVVIDGQGPAASLIPTLQDKGINVTTMGTNDVITSCALFYDAVQDSTIRHINQAQLNNALAVARKRTLRGGDSWVWHRKDHNDMTPLIAATQAHWALSANVQEAQKTQQQKVSTAVYTFN